MARARFWRARATVAVTAVALTSLTMGGASAATMTDGFEAGSATVFGPGTAQDCTIRQAGSCSLKLDPPCCSTYYPATSQVGVPLEGTTTMSFYIHGETTGGNLDSDIHVVLSNGHRVVLHTTAPSSTGGNNGVSLLSAAGHNIFGSWSAGVWTPITMTFQPSASTVTASVNNRSHTVSYPAAASILRVEWYGVRWGSGTLIRYDSLNVANTPVVVNTGPVTTLGTPSATPPLRYGGPHDFVVTGSDAQGDAYRPTVTVKDSSGTVVRTMQPPGLTSNDQSTTLRAEPHLPPGQYTWSARSVDSKGALGDPSETRSFTVDTGRYVALGDSFASGEGVPDFEEGTAVYGGNECHRSQKAYARLIAGAPGVPPGTAAFRACSGAETRNLIADSPVFEPHMGEGAQFEYLGTDVSLVTMSIGGNDSGFADVLTYCATNIYCHEEMDAYVWKRFRRLQGEALPAQSDPDYAELRGIHPLNDVYAKLREKAPHARVVIVGYPKFFSLEEGVGWFGRGCYSMDRTEQSWMNDKVHDLNAIIRDTATRNGFEYADVEDAFEGHHLCDGDPDWMHGIEYDGHYDPPVSRFSFHPNAGGHEAFAAAVRNVLAGTPASQTTHTVAPQQSAFRPVVIGPFLPRFSSILRWPGSDIELRLHSPSGRVIGRDTVAADVTRVTGPTYDVVEVANPEPGEWMLEMYGADVAPGGEQATLDVAIAEPVNQEPIAVISSAVSRNTITLDGSASSDPDGSIVRYSWDFGDDAGTTGVTASHTYAGPGQYTVTLTVYDDRGDATFTTIPVEITPYGFTGFGAPVNAAPTLNKVNAGRTIPVKWGITEDGLPVSDPASFVSITSVPVACDAAAPVDVLEEYAVSNAGLHYLGDGNWSYTWATDKAWAGTCRRMTLRLADGAIGRTAVFDFR